MCVIVAKLECCLGGGLKVGMCRRMRKEVKRRREYIREAMGLAHQLARQRVDRSRGIESALVSRKGLTSEDRCRFAHDIRSPVGIISDHWFRTTMDRSTECT